MSLYEKFKKKPRESTCDLIQSAEMDDRSSTSTVWVPMDYVPFHASTDQYYGSCDSRYSYATNLNSRYSYHDRHECKTSKERKNYVSLPKCCFLTETSQNKDQNDSINVTTPHKDTKMLTQISISHKDSLLNELQVLPPAKNQKKGLLAPPDRISDVANDPEFRNDSKYDDIKPTLKQRQYANLPKCFLPVPEVEVKRSKSFDGFEVERTQRPKNFRRTLSRTVCDHDSSYKPFETWSVSANRTGRLNTKLLEAIEYHNNVEVESMLHAGANPNATCRPGHISACHAAAYANSDALHLLLEFKADKNRKDKFGRTPLHLAAWAGRNWTIAMLLDFPVDLQYKVVLRVTSEAEEEIKALRSQLTHFIDVPCELPLMSVIPQSWKDSIEHKCRRYMTQLPKFFSGWTPLHIASYAAHHDATRLLLAAGANPNSKDAMGLTPLDIAGASCYLESRVNVDEYVKTIKSIIEFGGKLNVSETTSPKVNSALHTAVELCSVEAVEVLLAAGAPIWHQNAKGNTPLHDCVEKFCIEPLQVLAKHQRRGQCYRSIDVVDKTGYTVLHAAIMASWVPGVCMALDAGAVVILEAHDGKTAIHIAALKGDLDILDEILLNAAQYKNAVNYENGRTEPPIFCAIRSGNLECVQAFLDAGAMLKMTYYVEPTLGDTTMEPYLLSIPPDTLKSLNMILHATAEAGSVEMLELLFEHDKSLENLLCRECPYLMSMKPVEFAAYHNKFNTFQFLLQKTLARAQKLQVNFDHSRLLHIISIYNHEDLFRELIDQIPDAVRITNGKGYYPLHDAARNCNRNLIEQLIRNGADLSELDNHGLTAISVVINNISKPTEFLAKIFDDYVTTNYCKINRYDFKITVDYRALIPSTVKKLENKGQMRVLTALLKTENRQNQRKLLAHPLIESFLYLKWKTLTTYFYLMVFLYCLFVISLSVFTVSVFYYKDRHNQTESEHAKIPPHWNPVIWQYLIYFTLGIVVVQELSCTNLAPKKWVNRFVSIEFWIKLLAYSFAIALPLIVSTDPDGIPIDSYNKFKAIDWQRQLATLTLIFTWLNIMMLLSKTPMSGYYMQMFWMVSSKIIQILITFSFLILMFSFCFMVQFHSQVPFEGPWAAVVKTLVMMTSEFDYSGTFTKEKANDLQLTTPIQLLRVVFVVFLILTAIVLMNLMIGVAVHDVQYLVQDGNLKRLDKQVGFLNRLEVSRGKKSFFHFLGLYRWFHCKKVPQTVTIKPVIDVDCCYSSKIKDALINKAEQQLNKIEREVELNKMETKLENIAQNVKEIEVNVLHHIFDLKTSLQNSQVTAPHVHDHHQHVQNYSSS